MKIAFTAAGTDLAAPLDERFGRAAGFLLYDLETGAVQSIGNEQSLTAAHGAGIQAAETVARAGAGALVTRHCGPKAFRVLTAAGVTVFNTDAATVGEALGLYRAGRLQPAAAADVEGS